MSRVSLLNILLSEAGEGIFALDLGATAYVLLHENDGGDQLGWVEAGSEWMLVIQDGAGVVTPLFEATVEQKKAAAHKLPELLAALHDAATTESQELAAAIAAARAFVAGLAK